MSPIRSISPDWCTVLFEAAQAMLTRTIKWSWLKAWGMKIARHRGMKRAVVAVARRMAVRHAPHVGGWHRLPVEEGRGRRRIRTVRNNCNRRKLEFHLVVE
jgi:hypothetical protein